MKAWILAHKTLAVAGAVLLVAVGAFLFFYWFGFQTALVDRPVNEALPGTARADVGSPSAGGTPSQEGGEPRDGRGSGPVTLASGRFHDLEHHTSGTALLVELPGGERLLRLEDLDTLNGPDLKVYLSAAPADGPEDAFDDVYVGLGDLKGNTGNQNYAIPNGVNVSRYRSAVVWCERFSVGFGVAPLDPARG